FCNIFTSRSIDGRASLGLDFWCHYLYLCQFSQDNIKRQQLRELAMIFRLLLAPTISAEIYDSAKYLIMITHFVWSAKGYYMYFI
ncbi:hypothetical protein ACJX0J_017810, partial [Zea mays]